MVISLLTITHLTAAVSADTTTTTQAPLPSVDWRTATVDKHEVGEVLVNGIVVFQFRSTISDVTPSERANLVASRLADLLRQGTAGKDVNTKAQDANTLLRMGDAVIIIITPELANDYNTTPSALGDQWRANLSNALKAQPATTTTAPATTAATQEQWPAWTTPDTKIVPIISLGTPGLQLGFAQVSGPKERVAQVKSVVQLDAEFQKAARLRIFVPSSVLLGMNRVQGVAVSALLQYGLFRF